MSYRSSSASSCSSTSAHPVIPPIITCENDRQFLINLNNYIDEELSRINSTDLEQRFLIYKDSFNKIIDYVSVYKPLLTAIKAEYEDCIETIQRGRREALFLAGKVKAITSEPSTVHNYRKRADELDQKLSIIYNDNERLEEQVNALRKARLLKETKASTAEPAPKTEPKKDHRPIPGLTVKEATDIKILSRELEKLDKQLKELSLAHRTRYMPKETKEDLKQQLSKKVAFRDQLWKENEILKARRIKLRIAVEAGHAWVKIQPPHQTIGSAVISALARASYHTGTDKMHSDEGTMGGTPSATFEEDDPTREKEAEQMLEYIEKFNEFLEDEMYEEAALHAANSPKGILRTPETLKKFKGLQTKEDSKSPMLAFSEALIATVPAYGTSPSDYMSQECVNCALKENRLDLVAHWLGQERITLNRQIGNMLYVFSDTHPSSRNQSLGLAQQVFILLKEYPQAIICMIRQGRLMQAIDYACKRAKFGTEEFIGILRNWPVMTLAELLIEKKVLPIGVVIQTLWKTESYDTGLQLLQQIYLKSKGKSSDLKDAVFNDEKTTPEQWKEIIQHLKDQGYEEAAVELLAALTDVETQQAANITDIQINPLRNDEIPESQKMSESHVDNSIEGTSNNPEENIMLQ